MGGRVSRAGFWKGVYWESISHSWSSSYRPVEQHSDGQGWIFHMVVAPDLSPDHSRLWGYPIRSWVQDSGPLIQNNGLSIGIEGATFIILP